MSLPPEQIKAMPPPSLSGLAGSTLAVLALSMLLFLVASFFASLVAVMVMGGEQMLALGARINGTKAMRADEGVIIMVQIMGILLYASHIGAILLAAKFRKRIPTVQRVAFLDWQADRQYWWVLAATLAYIVVAGVALESVMPEARNWVVLPKTTTGLFLALILVAALAPVAEELLFRGWIFTGLRMKLSFLPALLITSVLFALAHFERTLVYALVIFPVGLALGFVRERYGSIKPAMVFHGLFNLFGLILNVVQRI